MEDFDFDFLVLETEEKMQNSIKLYEKNIMKINAGGANPQILNTVSVDYFGASTPISQLSNISVPEPRQILIKPYDISITKNIVASINKSSLGLNAVDEGDRARINLPEMTSERRRELVKSLGQYTEQAKVGIRGARHEANKAIKSSKTPEDFEKNVLSEIQTLTDKFVSKIDEITSSKSKELTTI